MTHQSQETMLSVEVPEFDKHIFWTKNRKYGNKLYSSSKNEIANEFSDTHTATFIFVKTFLVTCFCWSQNNIT